MTTEAVPTLFDDATAVHSSGDGMWDVELRDEFSIVDGRPNGGYLLAVLGRAALAAVGHDDRHVVSATTTYVSPPTSGPAVVRTEVLRQGRTASQVRAALVQDERVTVDVAMTVGSLSAAPQQWGDLPMVEMPDEATCRADLRTGRSAIPGLAEPPLSKVRRISFDPAVMSFLSGRPSGNGELRAWMALGDDRPWDPLSLLFAVDALPPATFEIAMTGWVPTLSLTAYVRALPAPGPVAVRFRANVIADGWVDETADVWDATGRLVAQSTQLAAIRMPS